MSGELKAESVGVVIAAAGASSRMQGVDKQFVELAGTPVLIRSAQAFEEIDYVREIVLVCREDEIPFVWQLQKAFYLSKVTSIVAGGNNRQESVFAGVMELGAECEYIAVHDGARPFVTEEVITDCLKAACEHRAAAAAMPVKDTIKQSDGHGFIAKTPAREFLYIAQTPQIFESGLYLSAMNNARARKLLFSDDCQLVEALGARVALSKGSYLNFKITTPEDLALARTVSEGEIR